MEKERAGRKPRLKTGSPIGLAICVAMGFAFYYGLQAIGGSFELFDYGRLREGILGSFPKQAAWFFMNFTEAQFYASLFAGIALIVGGFVAWRLAVRGSRFRGIEICYGSSTLFPWVLASQALSLALAIFAFHYLDGFADPNVTWVATFISVVAGPPSMMLLYGPSVPVLLSSSLLGGLISAPTAIWLSSQVALPWNLPGAVANLLAMAASGVMIGMVMKVLPWVKKVPMKPQEGAKSKPEQVFGAAWFVRRALADFSEPLFYGNEVASAFLLVGVSVGTAISKTHGAYGSEAVPAIILSQFVGAAVGIFLYTQKYDKGGWYATYVPVVSVGPACVLFFGATVPVALFAGALGGVLGAPLAQFFAEKLPEGIHVTVANVTSMALCTVIAVAVMQALPWF